MINLKNARVTLLGPKSMLGRQAYKVLFEEGAIIDCVYHEQCDLLSEQQTFKRIDAFRPQYVLNFAGFNGGIKYNSLLPLTIYYRTTEIALNVTNACCSYGVKKLVNVLTSCAYPGYNDGVLKEDMFLSGTPHESVECHGYAKRNAYIFGKQACKQYNIQVVGVILNNCYGPHDSFDPEKTKVVGGLVKRFVDAANTNQKEVVIWGTGKSRREFLYCEDAGRGVVEVLKKYDDISSPINIGWGEDVSIAELAQKIKELSGFKGQLVFDTSKPDGQLKKLLDVTRMNSLLDWKPKIDLDTGLRLTIDYYKDLLADKVSKESDR